jgi:tRNA(Arg) A34 adenosine deaminase TadA
MKHLLWFVLALAAVVAACADQSATDSGDDQGTAASEVNTCTSCTATMSPFAKKSISTLAAHFCQETKDGDKHENLPVTDDVQKERDTIFILLSFALTSKYWDLNRGQQIGAVLVDGDRVLKFGFNSNFQEESQVEHAEVRAIRSFYADAHGNSDLEHATIYGTLEPCPMCAGTITMAKVKRAVFGMKDNRFGDAMAYLHSFPYHADYELHTSTRTSKALADAADRDPNASLGKMFENMKNVFDYAVADLNNFQVQHRENQNALSNAKAALR